MEKPQLSSDSGWAIYGIVICEKSNEQEQVQICSDGEGGAIIVWRDHISGTDYDIYAQKVNSTGDIQWDTDGILIGLIAGDDSIPQICSDGEGGAIISWEGYVQRVNSTGGVLWTANGTIISTLSGGKWDPQICSDGRGGAIITWYEFIYGSDFNVYAQKVNSTGDIKWTTTGIAICSANNSQIYPQLCSDENGGAIITWEDYRNYAEYADVYTQKIDSSGNIQWVTDGVAICTENDSQKFPQICSDGARGAIITWEDRRDQSSNIYAQMTDSSGKIEWTNNGMAICMQNNDQLYSQLCSDGAGGAIFTWQDRRNGLESDIYTQKIDSSGNIQWTSNGVAICTENDSQTFPRICGDGAGGAIITWEDRRDNNYDIYAQKIDSTGDIKWHINGIGMTSDKFRDMNIQKYPEICPNGEGDAIIAWENEVPSPSKRGIYAQSTKYVTTRLKKKSKVISFGNYYFLFTILGVISLIIIKKRRIFYKFK